MNVRLEYPMSFYASIHYKGQYFANKFNIVLQLLTGSEDVEEQNIALDRIKYLVKEVVEHSIFVHQREKALIKKLESAGMQVITLPEDPVDQIIGMALFYKLNAVVEDRMAVLQTRISSEVGENMTYLHCEDEPAGPFEDKGWWDFSDPHFGKFKNLGKVVELTKHVNWDDLGMGWFDDTEGTKDFNIETPTANTVVPFNKPEK